MALLAAPASPERGFDSLRQMRFHSNRAMVPPRGLQSLQESGHRRPRHVPIMARPPWRSQEKRGDTMDRVERFFMVVTTLGVVGAALSIAWIMLI